MENFNCINITMDFQNTDKINSSPPNINSSIKRPNSTLGIPNSVLEPQYFSGSNQFKPIKREKATSLTLDSNSYENSQSNIQCGSQRTSPRTSPIISNGNILCALSPTPPVRPPAPMSSKIHIRENPMGSSMTTSISASNVTNRQRASYTEGEALKLQQQYFHGRKERIISIGQSFHIQVKKPSANILQWKQKTSLEKCLLISVACLSLLSGLFVLTIIKNGQIQAENGPSICYSIECVKTAASLLNAMDLTADPCDDFFQYACGTWNKKHVIPEDRSSVSTFEVLADELQIILKDLLEKSATNYDNSATIKAKMFYKSCMQMTKIEEIGDKPLRKVINSLGGWPVIDKWWSSSPWQSETLLGKLRGDFNQGLIVEQWVGPDDRNSSINIIQFDQMSFGLPSRDYFLKDVHKKDRDAYLKLMVEIAVLFGAERSYANEEMKKVLAFETLLANSSMPEADRHDTGAIYKKTTLKELKTFVPEFDWMVYLNSFLPTQVSLVEPVVVYSLDYFKEMGKIISRHDKKIIHNFVIWRLVNHILPYLNGEYTQRRAEFRKILSGISADRIRWNQCVDLVNKKMGMAVGALFIRDNFDPKSKETALEMIYNIREAFNELVSVNVWMDDETRKVAIDKANSINERIGYPELLTNSVELSNEYQTLQINESEFLLNVLNMLKFDASRNLIKLRQPVNKDRWTTEPAVVNAFYNPNKNDIVFPAGILQPFFYSQHFPKSLNYGGIGVVIGHEITHGFDDKGRQFDKNGNLKQWWNNATISRFRQRAQCIIDQYASYVLEEIGMNINGKMTQGENIADNGGLKQSYKAFKKWESVYGVEPLLPGLNLNHDQLFFLNYAQIWCGSMRPEDALSKIRSSVHSPGPIRVLGPLSNSYDFARIYHCPIGSRMNPVKKCSVW